MDEKLTKIYLTTDNHFDHERIITAFGFRPANFEKLIINNWKNTVDEDDIIFNLGDVTWGSQGHLQQIMGELPGTKILIRGNHDKSHSNNWFVKAGFAAVLEKAQVSGVILSHRPALLHKEEIERGIINIHGHFHNSPTDKWEEYLKERITKNHYLLSIENTNYTPISLELIKRGKFVKNSKKLLESERESVISDKS